MSTGEDCNCDQAIKLKAEVFELRELLDKVWNALENSNHLSSTSFFELRAQYREI